MLQYWPIFPQEMIGKGDLKDLSESELSDLEQRAKEIFPLMVPVMKVSFIWPFWTGLKKYGLWVSFVFNILALGSTFFYAARVIGNNKLDMNLGVELCIQILIQFFIIFATYFIILDKQGIALLFVMMIRNLFQCSSEERKFLQYYINIANFASYIITGFICSAYSMYFVIIPVLWPVIANFILPGNHTYDKTLSAHIELFIDEKTYFYYYFVIVLILCFTTQVFISSLGTVYTISVAYVVAKFRFMGFKLKQILILSEADNFSEQNDDIFKQMSQLVQLHQFCINFFDWVNSITSPIFLLAIFDTIIGSSISGYVVVMKHKESINIALKMGFVYIICVECLFMTSYPSQMVSNASSDIFDDCYSTDWYRYSIKTRKMIQLIMSRSIRHSCVTIGPSNYCNYETSRQITQLSLSYMVSLMSIYGP